jgi:hypothetical protein
MTTKKKYMKPAVQVFELEQRPVLLAGSGTDAEVDVTLGEEDWSIPSAPGMTGLPDELLLP